MVPIMTPYQSLRSGFVTATIVLLCSNLHAETLVHVSNMRQDSVWVKNTYIRFGVPILGSGTEFEAKYPEIGWGTDFGHKHLELNKSLNLGTVGLASGSVKSDSNIPIAILPGWSLGTQLTVSRRVYAAGNMSGENRLAARLFARRNVKVTGTDAHGASVHFKVQFILSDPSEDQDIDLDVHYGASGGIDNFVRVSWNRVTRKWDFVGTRMSEGQHVVPVLESHGDNPFENNIIVAFDMYKYVIGSEVISLQTWCNWYNGNRYTSHGQTTKSRGVANVNGGHTGSSFLTYLGVEQFGD